MTTTHDDNATTWRDLADQLTPEQIAKLEESERRYRFDAVSLAMCCTWAPRTNALHRLSATLNARCLRSE